MAFGLPIEGTEANVLRAADIARRDLPTCHPGDQLGPVHERVQAAGWGVCIVVNEANVVLGRLRGDIWNAPADTVVQDIMENGPTTFRPDNKAQALVDRMRRRNVENTLITRSDGALIGMFYRAEAEARLTLAQQPDGHEQARRGEAGSVADASHG